MAMTINADDCTGCGSCESDCPSRAIRMKGAVCVIDPKKCTECEGVADSPLCDAACPTGAILKAA